MIAALDTADREYVATLEADTRKLHAEALQIQAEATRIAALNSLTFHERMRRSDEFHARHPRVKYVVMGVAVLGGLVVGFAAGMVLWR